MTLKRPVGSEAYLPDMYMLTVINNEAEQQVHLRLEVEEQQDGMVGIIETAVFALPKGVSDYHTGNHQTLLPLEVIQSQKKYETFTVQNNQLPPGQYRICVYLISDREGQELARDCYTVSFEDFLPPYLISPADRDLVHSQTPFFFWSPASPPPSAGQFEYTLLITEILHSQSPVAAIKSNRFWVKKENIASPSFQYPEFARELEEGQPYAWQVIAYLEGEKIAESEVWEFSYSATGGQEEKEEKEKGAEEKDLSRQTYYELSAGQSAGFYRLREPYLPFIYDNPYGSEKPAVRLLNNSGSMVYEGALEEAQKHGLNKNIIDLSVWGALKPGATYLFSLTNQQGEIYRLRFNYEPQE